MIDGDPIAAAICTVMSRRTVWTQTATELLGALAEVAGERAVNSKTWPASPRALAGRLRRAATFLRKMKIEIEFEREGRARTRIIRITNTANHSAPESRGTGPSAPSASSALTLKISSAHVSAGSDLRTVANGADDPTDANDVGNARTVRTTIPKNNSETTTDGATATWLNKNPVTSPANVCIFCGAGDRPNDALLPFGTTPPGAAWLHGTCWPIWSRDRRDQAAAALASIGVNPLRGE